MTVAMKQCFLIVYFFKPVRYCLPSFLLLHDYYTSISSSGSDVFNLFIKLHQLLFGGREIRSATVFHVPIGDSVSPTN